MCSSSSCPSRTRRPRPPEQALPPGLFASRSRRSLRLGYISPFVTEALTVHSVVDADVLRRHGLDRLDLLFLALVAAADDAEAARSEGGIRADRQAANRVPAEPLAPERVHRHSDRRVFARLVVLIDRTRDRLEVLGFGGRAHLTLSPPPSSFPAGSSGRASRVRRSTSGSQPSRSRARVMSGWRTCGSSTGSASNTISERDSVSSTTSWAISSSDSSAGLPMLTGSWSPDSARRLSPRIRSAT